MDDNTPNTDEGIDPDIHPTEEQLRQREQEILKYLASQGDHLRLVDDQIKPLKINGL